MFKRESFYCIITTILLLASCAGTPQIVDSVPQWYSNPPSNDRQYVYFTQSVQKPAGENIDDAVSQLLYRDILDFMGIPSEQGDQSFLSDFRKKVFHLVKMGTGLEGFTLMEKDRQELEVPVLYLLVRAERTSIDDWKKILIDNIRSGASASDFARKAEANLEKGEFYKGALNYLLGALDASEGGNSFIAEQNLVSALEIFNSIKLANEVHPDQLSVGKSALFSCSLYVGEGESRWKDTPFRVSFLDRKKGAVIGERFALLRSDEKGVVNFVHPSPGFAGKGMVSLSFDPFREIKGLDRLEADFPQHMTAIKAAVAAVSRTWTFDVVSSAPSIPTAVMIVDSDLLRRPLESNHTAEGLLNGLSSEGFNVSPALGGHKELLDLSEEEFLRDLPYIVDSSFKRVVYGVASIEEYNDSGTGYAIVTEARLKVVDVKTGELLFNEILSKRVQGADSQTTMNTAFKELGRSFTTLLIDKLP